MMKQAYAPFVSAMVGMVAVALAIRLTWELLVNPVEFALAAGAPLVVAAVAGASRLNAAELVERDVTTFDLYDELRRTSTARG